MDQKLIDMLMEMNARLVRVETKLDAVIKHWGPRINRLEGGFIWVGTVIVFAVLSGLLSLVIKRTS